MDEQATTPTPVSGWSIFWTLLTLSLSCITHPLGTSCGFPRPFKTAVRINPFSTLFDSIHLLREILLYHSSHHLTWYEAIHHAITERLNANHTDRVLHDKDLKPIRAASRARSVIAVLCILQYTKACGCHGTPIFFYLSTTLFLSWVILETSFCASLHTRNPHRPISSQYHTLPLRAGIWSFILLAAALLTIAPIPAAAILDTVFGLTARSIVVWHNAVLWLPLIVVGWAPASFREFPNPEDGYIKILVVLYGIMIGFLVLVVLYWVLAIAGVGVVFLPVYLVGRVCVPFVLRSVERGCNAGVVVSNPRGLVRVVVGVAVVAVVVGLGAVYEPEGTRKEWWVEWMP